VSAGLTGVSAGLAGMSNAFSGVSDAFSPGSNASSVVSDAHPRPPTPLTLAPHPYEIQALGVLGVLALKNLLKTLLKRQVAEHAKDRLEFRLSKIPLYCRSLSLWRVRSRDGPGIWG
jgi:hypothetical protein